MNHVNLSKLNVITFLSDDTTRGHGMSPHLFVMSLSWPGMLWQGIVLYYFLVYLILLPYLVLRSRDGALASHWCDGAGLTIPALCYMYMWVEFVIAWFSPRSEGFFWVLQFYYLEKTSTPLHYKLCFFLLNISLWTYIQALFGRIFAFKFSRSNCFVLIGREKGSWKTYSGSDHSSPEPCLQENRPA